MVFTPKDWQNAPSIATPVNAAAIEDLEIRVTDYTDQRGGLFNVKEDYGADPTGVASSTAAFNGAIADALASSTPGCVVVPRGTYLCGDLDVITDKGLKIVGIGGPKSPETGATSSGLPQITHTGAGVLFDLGTFDSTPANYWVGEAQGFHIEGLRLYNNAGQAQGSRTRTAIRDNGCGNAILRDVEISDFQYGFAAPYGGDFSAIEDCFFGDCDVGVYVGPGSQQVDISRSEFFFCMEGFVADSSPQGLMSSCWFIDSRTVDCQFEKLDTTRFGLSSGGNALNNLKWTLRSTWHESNANGDNVKATNGHIRTYTDNAGDKTYPRGLRVVDPFLSAGGSGGANRSFWECTDGQSLRLEDLLVDGDQVAYAMNSDTGATWLTQKGLRTVDGYTDVIPFRNEDTTCIYLVEGQSAFGMEGVTSAATVTMPAYVDRVSISAANNISRITPGYPGRIITLYFESTPTVVWAGGGGDNIYMDGGANFSATAGDTLSLMAKGGDWYEVGRSVN